MQPALAAPLIDGMASRYASRQTRNGPLGLWSAPSTDDFSSTNRRRALQRTERVRNQHRKFRSLLRSAGQLRIAHNVRFASDDYAVCPCCPSQLSRCALATVPHPHHGQAGGGRHPAKAIVARIIRSLACVHKNSVCSDANVGVCKGAIAPCPWR